MLPRAQGGGARGKGGEGERAREREEAITRAGPRSCSAKACAPRPTHKSKSVACQERSAGIGTLLATRMSDVGRGRQMVERYSW